MNSERYSGIEILKIIAIVMLVVNHVINVFSGSAVEYMPTNEYVIDMTMATTNIQFLILAILQLGSLWNDIFFICSAWFLLDSDRWSRHKWFRMLTEIWVISFLFLIAISAIFKMGGRAEAVSAQLVIKSLFPTTMSSYWYMTAYLMFYPLHPALNRILRSMSQRTLLVAATILTVMYIVLNGVWKGFFFYNTFVVWITLYVMMAYMKWYMPVFINNVKLQRIILMLSIIGYVVLVFMTNWLGLQVEALSDKVMYWSQPCNPFFVMIAISVFHIARQSQWKNVTINRLAGLSMLVYVIHGNCLLSTYIRPYEVLYIYERWGYQHVLLWVLILSMVVLTFAVCIAVLYKLLLQSRVYRMAASVEQSVSELLMRYTDALMRIR